MLLAILSAPMTTQLTTQRNNREIELNDYNESVYKYISVYLEGNIKKWLKKVCKPFKMATLKIQTCFPSSLIISILSSGKICNLDLNLPLIYLFYLILGLKLVHQQFQLYF